LSIVNSAYCGNSRGVLSVSVSIIAISLFALSFLFLGGSAFDHHTNVTEANVETVKYRNLTLDLGNGVKTNAQVTIPALGEGPFPGVLLIPGSSANCCTP
jgi:hypothetical protein